MIIWQRLSDPREEGFMHMPGGVEDEQPGRGVSDRLKSVNRSIRDRNKIPCFGEALFTGNHEPDRKRPA